MALDLRYIPTKYFQEIFLDKDTGCPLSGGVVKFYRDNARTTPKEIFELTGTPPNYTYTPLGTSVTLSSSGTFQDTGGNDITVYLFPYDDSGNIDLYYATVESSGAVIQITREGFPNVAPAEDEEEDELNYVPNGQFLLHHDIVTDEGATPPIEAGEITQDVTDIAEGGWSFERTVGTAAKDFVLFPRIGSYVEIPSKSPRYSLYVKNEAPGIADVFKDVRLTFRDVNKFASDTQKYTFAFQAKSSGGATTIEIKLRKFYGAGGSTTEETVLQVINLTATYQLYDIPFIFGDNDGKTIGANDDDYVQLNISLPVASAFDNTFDNFMLIKGDKQIDEFPDTTDAEFIKDSNAGWMPVPDYEGADLYLPIRKGLKGLEYDTSQIGKVFMASDEGLKIGELWGDAAKYRVAAYSSDNIPYRRLYEAYSVNSDIGLAIYGTGENEYKYVRSPAVDQTFTNEPNDLASTDSWQSFTAGNNDQLIAITVKLGGVIPTTIDLTILEGAGIAGTVLSRNNGLTLALGVNTIYIANPFTQASASQYTIRFETNTNLTWKGDNAGGYVGGTYKGTAADAYFITKSSTTGAQTIYDLISNTAGAVTSAADGATATGFTFLDVVTEATRPYVCQITTVAASGMTAGSYFTYETADTRKQIAWYEIDGSGTKPVEVAIVYRKVSILSTDDAATVNNKTAIAINSYSVATPDYRGYFFRATDHGAGHDPDAAIREPRPDGVVGDNVGTLQQDGIGEHKHPGITAGASGFGTGTAGGEGAGELNTGATGDTRPKNRNVNAVVKY